MDAKRHWVLLALRRHPLDRIHLMKALFLVWRRVGRLLPDFFRFEPYMYGPYSLEVYSILEGLEADGLIVHPPDEVQEWQTYYLTERGAQAAALAAKTTDPNILAAFDLVSDEVSGLSFQGLLRRVYAEAPEYAVNSVMRGLVD